MLSLAGTETSLTDGSSSLVVGAGDAGAVEDHAAAPAHPAPDEADAARRGRRERGEREAVPGLAAAVEGRVPGPPSGLGVAELVDGRREVLDWRRW